MGGETSTGISLSGWPVSIGGCFVTRDLESETVVLCNQKLKYFKTRDGSTLEPEMSCLLFQMERFLPHQDMVVMSVFAPVTFGPCPVLVFKVDDMGKSR